MHRDLCIGIDVVDSCFHHIGFVLANGLSGGDDLPVEICQTYPVIVDQVKGANAAANQRLTYISAHSADAEYSHPGTLKPFNGGLSQKQLRSGKLVEHIIASCSAAQKQCPYDNAGMEVRSIGKGHNKSYYKNRNIWRGNKKEEELHLVLIELKQIYKEERYILLKMFR